MDRSEFLDEKCIGILVLVWLIVVADDDLAPQTAFQQARVAAVETVTDGDAATAEVLHLRPVALFLFTVRHAHLVDEFMAAILLDQRLSGVRFIRTHKIPLQRLVHRGEAGFDFFGIVGGTVSGEQEFQHEGGSVGSLLDPLHEVLADHSAWKDRIDFIVEGIHGNQWWKSVLSLTVA